MAPLMKNQPAKVVEEEEELSHETKELLSSLPKERGWRTRNIYLYEGFWCQPKEIQAIRSIHEHFKPRDGDVILATIPKSGTTWLKALAFAIANRTELKVQSDHPLLTSNPHDLVPFLEYKLYADVNRIPDLSAPTPGPRLFATHVPFSYMRRVVGGARVVYVCRNPFDTFVSIWHYMSKLRPHHLGPFSMDEAFDVYCSGEIGYGPYREHILGYWRESLESPQKVLFLKYEDMKEDISRELKKLAEFMGCPFSLEEEKEGVVEEIGKLCSFESLKQLDVNKDGRKGEVGDWVNYFTPSMVDRLSKLVEEKFADSGLTFKLV